MHARANTLARDGIRCTRWRASWRAMRPRARRANSRRVDGGIE